MEDNDAQLQLKKRARRRLVGAVFFASLVALVLPMLMDHDPRPPVQDLDIRIPGQDDKPFTPSLAPVSEPVASAPSQPANATSIAPVPAVPVTGALAGMAAERQSQPAANPPKQAAPEPAARPEKAPSAVDKPTSEKTASKPTPAEKPVAKAPSRPEGLAETPAVQDDEARRAAAILAGRSPDAKTPAAAAGSHVILIGAFSNEGNVRTLKSKLGEQGIKVYTDRKSVV
jgi:DedD protein